MIRSRHRADGSFRRRLACKSCDNRWSVLGKLEDWAPLDHRPVVNLDTGVTYPNVQAAANAVYVVRSTIRKSISRGWRAGGYRWQYLDQLPNVTMCEPVMALTARAPDDGLTGGDPHYPN